MGWSVLLSLAFAERVRGKTAPLPKILRFYKLVVDVCFSMKLKLRSQGIDHLNVVINYFMGNVYMYIFFKIKSITHMK